MPRVNSKRASPKNQRLEVVLKAVQSGSLFHLSELKKLWPNDPSGVKRALEAIFAHLRAAVSSERRSTARNKEDVHRSILLTTALEVIEETALSDKEDMSKECTAQVLNVFDLHLPTYIAALEFRTQDHATVLPRTWTKETSIRIVYNLNARSAYRLINLGLQYFESQEGHHSLGLLVDYILKCWIGGITKAASSQETDISPDQYWRVSNATYVMIGCLRKAPLKSLMMKSVASYDKKRLKKFAKSFVYHCSDWSAVHTSAYQGDPLSLTCEPLAAIVIASQTFAREVPALHASLLRVKFPSLVLETARRFHLTLPTADSKFLSIEADMSSRFLRWSLLHAWAVAHTLPDLLDSGLLESLIEDILTPGQQNAVLSSKRDLLWHICGVAHHPAVYRALSAAAVRSDNLLRRAETDRAARESLGVLIETLGMMYRAHRWVSESQQPLMCACLEHDSAGAGSMPKILECSGCRAVTYCSEKCQKRDWEMLHREECAQSRLHRMKYDMQGIWLTHLEQVKHLYYSEDYLSLSLDSFPPPEPGSQPADRSSIQPSIWVVFATEKPIKCNCVGAEDFFAINARLNHDDKRGTPAFEDRRFRAMVQQSEGDPNIRLIGSLSTLGHTGYWIAALAAFDLSHPLTAEDGRKSRRMLRGHVRIFETFP